jgi:hypothetical protein
MEKKMEQKEREDVERELSQLLSTTLQLEDELNRIISYE